VRFAANRGLRVRRSAADRLVTAARTALPAPEAVVARQVLADDLGLLAELDVQIAAAEAQIAKLLPDTPFAVLLTVPGWGTTRPATTAPRSATRVAGREPASSTAPPDCPLRSMSRLGSVGTVASAGKAVWLCGGR
jgi:transposase